MPAWHEVPNWKFGDVLAMDYPSEPTQEVARVLFLSWTYRADFNPTESIFQGLLLVSAPKWDQKPGEVITPYCGWWKPAPVALPSFGNYMTVGELREMIDRMGKP